MDFLIENEYLGINGKHETIKNQNKLIGKKKCRFCQNDVNFMAFLLDKTAYVKLCNF